MAKSKKHDVAKMKAKGTKTARVNKMAKATKTSTKQKVIAASRGASGKSSNGTDSDFEDLTSGDQGETTTITDEVEVLPEPLTEFTLFTRLPMEIQQMIFMEAMRKPAVHFTEIKHHVHEPGKWTLSMHPVNGSGDTSMYRKLRRLGSVCPAAARAVHYGTQDKHRLPFSARGLKSAGVDTRHDLVHVMLRSSNIGISNFGPWYPASFGASNSILDVARTRHMLRGISNISLKIDVDTLPYTCFSQAAPFRSLLRIQEHRLFCMCPEELSGFLDLFPDLRTVYWLLIERRREYKVFLREYTEAVYKRKFSRFITTFRTGVCTFLIGCSSSTAACSITNELCFPVDTNARESMGLAIFHDSENAYIQFDPNLAASLPIATGPANAVCARMSGSLTERFAKFTNAVKEAMTSDRHPTRPISVGFQNSFSQRSGIKFSGLLKAAESANRIL